MNTHVIKVGGENASDIRTAEWLANKYQNGEQITVAISALRTKPLNTTSELIKARDAFTQSGMQSALAILENLFRVHIETLQEAGMYDRELEEKLRTLFEVYFPENLDFPLPQGQYENSDLGLDNLSLHNTPFGLRLPIESVRQPQEIAYEQRFIGYGEVMSAHVLAHILDTRFHVANSIIDHTIRVDSRGKDLSEILRDEVGYRVNNGLQNGLVIVPGYVSVFEKSILKPYKRGYTDKIAERIAVGLSDLGHAPILHIQKQVPILSSNPQKINNTRPISQLSYWSAAEITGAHGANAQVLNENTITSELSERNIPVIVYNPFFGNAPVSRIFQVSSTNSGILFVDGRDHVSTITVSGFSLTGPGLLSQLTDCFASQSIAIDSISSSETEATFTTYTSLNEYQRSELWRQLGNTLGSERNIDIKNNLGMIYCIGDNLAGHPGLLEKITGVLASANIDIECISQSRGQRAVTIGVSTNDLERGIQILHDHLIG